MVMGSGDELFRWVATYGKYVGYFAGFVMIWLTRKRPLIVSLLITILVMDTAAPNLGLQSLSWIVPIGLIATRYNAVGWFIAGALIHMLISYWGIHLAPWLYKIFTAPNANAIVQLSSLTVWLVIFLWWIQEFTGNIKILPNFFYNGHLAPLESERG